MLCWIIVWTLALLGDGMKLNDGAFNGTGLALSTGFTQTGQLASQGKTAKLERWCGRLGDNLFRLMHALRYAEQKSFDALQVPAVEGNYRVEGFFRPSGGQTKSKPWLIQIKKQSSNPRRWPRHWTDEKSCTKNANNDVCGPYPYYCSLISTQDRYRVMQTYVKPLLEVPKDAFKDQQEELVIHIRSGDTLTQTKYGRATVLEARQPPCAVYHKIIAEGVGGKEFHHVRVITEQDRKSPCIQQIIRRHKDKNITVQSNERSVDASAILNARHLVASHTYFTSMMLLLNSNLETLVTVNYGDYMSNDLFPCDAKKVKIFSITFPGMDKVYEPEHREAWMASFQEQQLSMRQTC